MTSDSPPETIEDRVMNTALEILFESGLGGLTIEEITNRSGIAKTTIYRRYASAEEVGIRAIKCTIEELEIPDTGSLRGDIRAFYDFFLAITADPGFRRIVLSIMSEAVTKPELRAVHQEMDAERQKVIETMIDNGRARGEVTRSLDLQQAMAMIEGPLFVLRVIHDSPIDEHAIEELLDAVCAALA